MSEPTNILPFPKPPAPRPPGAPVRHQPNRDSVTTINEDGSRYKLHPADAPGRFLFWRRLSGWALIVIYFVLPTIWSVLGQIVGALRTPAEWLDTGRTTSPLFDSAALTARQWEQLGTSMALWLLVPMVVGLWRLGRKEIA